jgi:hypothetical protein
MRRNTLSWRTCTECKELIPDDWGKYSAAQKEVVDTQGFHTTKPNSSY